MPDSTRASNAPLISRSSEQRQGRRRQEVLQQRHEEQPRARAEAPLKTCQGKSATTGGRSARVLVAAGAIWILFVGRLGGAGHGPAADRPHRRQPPAYSTREVGPQQSADAGDLLKVVAVATPLTPRGVRHAGSRRCDRLQPSRAHTSFDRRSIHEVPPAIVANLLGSLRVSQFRM